jgi:hypothetical protein
MMKCQNVFYGVKQGRPTLDEVNFIELEEEVNDILCESEEVELDIRKSTAEKLEREGYTIKIRNNKYVASLK